MKVSQIVVSMMIFSVVILGVTSFQGSLMENYDKPKNTENITSMNKSQNLTDKMKKIQNNIAEFEVANPLTWGNLVGLGINMFSVLWAVPDMIHRIAVDMAGLVGLPGWVAPIIEGIALAIFVFGAYRALKGGEI